MGQWSKFRVKKWRLDSSIVHQIQNTVRQMTHIVDAKSMTPGEKMEENILRDDMNTEILFHAVEPSSESVLKNDENALKTGIACKIETAASGENLPPKDLGVIALGVMHFNSVDVKRHA